MQPIYRPLLKKAWHISRAHFVLWPLAFFASLVGIAGTFQIFFDILGSDDQPLTSAGLITQSDLITSIFVGWSQSFDQIPWSALSLGDLPLVAFFFVLLIIVLAVTVLIISSEGGLIHAIGKLFDNQKVTYSQSFRIGLDNFWALLSINIIFRLVYLLTIGLIVFPLLLVILQTSAVNRLALSVLIYLIIIPLIVVLDLVARYSIIYIILQKKSIPQSLKEAWLLFRTNWVTSIETALMILVTLLAAFLIFSLIILPTIITLLTIFGTVLSFSEPALQLAAVFTLTTVIIVVAIFVTVFTTLQMAMWVGIFRKITSEHHYSKAHRATRHLPWLHKKFI